MVLLMYKMQLLSGKEPRTLSGLQSMDPLATVLSASKMLKALPKPACPAGLPQQNTWQIMKPSPIKTASPKQTKCRIIEQMMLQGSKCVCRTALNFSSLKESLHLLKKVWMPVVSANTLSSWVVMARSQGKQLGSELQHEHGTLYGNTDEVMNCGLEDMLNRLK